MIKILSALLGRLKWPKKPKPKKPKGRQSEFAGLAMGALLGEIKEANGQPKRIMEGVSFGEPETRDDGRTGITLRKGDAHVTLVLDDADDVELCDLVAGALLLEMQAGKEKDGGALASE